MSFVLFLNVVSPLHRRRHSSQMSSHVSKKARTFASSTPSSTNVGAIPPPHNNLVGPLLTDMYQLTMVYAYWKANRHSLDSSFELFFRKPPFDGEITVMSGLDQVLSFLQHFKFEQDDIAYVKTLIPTADESFFEYLTNLTCADITVKAIPQGSLCFPRIPLLTISGPLGVCQLLETTLLTLINYPSLVTTNAARFRIAAGPDKVLLEVRGPGNN